MLASVMPSHIGRTFICLLPVVALYSSALLAQETGIPFKSNGGDAASQFLDVLWLLGLLMGVAAVIVAVYRKRLVNDGSIPAERGVHLKVLDRKVLSTRLTAHVVEVGGRKLLICDSGQGVAIKEIASDTSKESAEA